MYESELFRTSLLIFLLELYHFTILYSLVRGFLC